MAVYVIVFGVAAALFWGLRRLGRRMQAQGPVLPAPAEAEDTTLADNLEFVADLATRAGRRSRNDNRPDGGTENADSGSGDAGGSGGDGGGGDGG